MRGIRVWARLLGLRRAVVEDVRIGSEGELIVSCRPGWRERDRCGVCRRRSAGYDLGEGRRRWRALDLGTTFCFVEADAPRVSCRRHGVVVAAVPWARHDARFTRSFEDQVAWLACNCSKTAVSELMRIAWRSVGSILERVCEEARGQVDLLDGLRQNRIDEISHRKGQRYLTVVVDHHSGRLVSAAPAATAKRSSASSTRSAKCAAPRSNWCPATSLRGSPARRRALPGRGALRGPLPRRAAGYRGAGRDPPRGLARGSPAGQHGPRARLKGARFAVSKTPANLTTANRKAREIRRTNARLYRAYLLKERLHQMYRVPAKHAEALLNAWLASAQRCRLPSFVKLARTIKQQRDGILAAIKHGLSNARIEQINTQIH